MQNKFNLLCKTHYSLTWIGYAKIINFASTSKLKFKSHQPWYVTHSPELILLHTKYQKHSQKEKKNYSLDLHPSIKNHSLDLDVRFQDDMTYTICYTLFWVDLLLCQISQRHTQKCNKFTAWKFIRMQKSLVWPCGQNSRSNVINHSRWHKVLSWSILMQRIKILDQKTKKGWAWFVMEGHTDWQTDQ